MIVLWGVYFRHFDPELLWWLKQEYPCLATIFVPTNITDLCNPLNIYLNANLNTTLSHSTVDFISN